MPLLIINKITCFLCLLLHSDLYATLIVFVYGKHDEQEFTGLNIVWVGTILDRIFWIAIIRVEIFQVGIFQVGDILDGNFPGGSYPGWELSGWELFWVGIVRVGVILDGKFLWWGFSVWELSGGNHPGGNFPGGSFPSTSFTNPYAATKRFHFPDYIYSSPPFKFRFLKLSNRHPLLN